MPNNFKKASKLAVALLITVHTVLFVYIHTRPILWQNNEITFHKFFWSINGIGSTIFNIYPQLETAVPSRDLGQLDKETFEMHLGFRPIDFLKPFVSAQVDGPFRFRQFSYFLEMVSAKFWQYFEVASFRNYTLVGIHILNVILLFFLISRLTKNRFAAWSGSLLFLNSGVAIATLLYPQRNAKLLVMTFFLVDWLIVARNQGDFLRIKLKWKISLLLIFFLATLTDELAFIMFPFLLVYIALSRGGRQLYHRQALAGVAVAVLLTGILYFGAFLLSRAIDMQTNLAFQGGQTDNLGKYLRDISTLTDTVRAFFGYFLRRNFGHWDWSPWGILAFASFWSLAAISFFKIGKNKFRKIILALIFLIGIKAFFLPHSAGFHEIIMPAGTKFPSLLFFDFYYTYGDSLLSALILAICLSNVLQSAKEFFIIAAYILAIVMSNVIHLRNGPNDCLKFEGARITERQEIIKDVFALKKILAQRHLRPVYLSFPSENELLFGARLYEPESKQYLYPIYINTLYLRSILEGRALVSLQNIKPRDSVALNQELQAAKTFYDVSSHKSVDLEAIRNGAQAPLLPKGIPYPLKTILINFSENKIGKIIFFVKGRANIMCIVRDQVIQQKQLYGNSYQIFELTIDAAKIKNFREASLTIYPADPQHEVFLVGPFIF